MKRKPNKLLRDQVEFGFTAETFNLIQDEEADLRRIAREVEARTEAAARSLAMTPDIFSSGQEVEP